MKAQEPAFDSLFAEIRAFMADGHERSAKLIFASCDVAVEPDEVSKACYELAKSGELDRRKRTNGRWLYRRTSALKPPEKTNAKRGSQIGDSRRPRMRRALEHFGANGATAIQCAERVDITGSEASRILVELVAIGDAIKIGKSTASRPRNIYALAQYVTADGEKAAPDPDQSDPSAQKNDHTVPQARPEPQPTPPAQQPGKPEQTADEPPQDEEKRPPTDTVLQHLTARAGASRHALQAYIHGLQDDILNMLLANAELDLSAIEIYRNKLEADNASKT